MAAAVAGLGLGGLPSCVTRSVQAGFLGTMSAMFYNQCSIDPQLCCTTSVTLTFLDGNQTTIKVSPQISQKWMDLLNSLNLLLIPWGLVTDIDGQKRGLPGVGEPNSGRWFESGYMPDFAEGREYYHEHKYFYKPDILYRWGNRDVIFEEITPIECSAYNTLQVSILLMLAATLPGLFTSCILPVWAGNTRARLIPPILIQPQPLTPAQPLAPTQLQAPLTDASLFRPPVRLPPGVDFSPDGCSRNSTEFQGTCRRILRNGPNGFCGPFQWLVLTPDSIQSTCRLRLCGRGRVFLVSDQLCHDVREAGLCPGDRRLYVTAFGSPACDCYDGHFQGPNGSCIALFSQGPCVQGEIWSLADPSGSPGCAANPCASQQLQDDQDQDQDDQPQRLIAPYLDGNCYALGERGPCLPGEVLGYSISRRQTVCTTLLEAGYAISEREATRLDSVYPQVQQLASQTVSIKRQDGGPLSAAVIPVLAANPGTVFETALLAQCQPGAARDINYKCRDIIIGPNLAPTERDPPAPPVPPLFSCPNDQCFNDIAVCVSCEQALVDSCNLGVQLNLQQDDCQTLAQGLG